MRLLLLLLVLVPLAAQAQTTTTDQFSANVTVTSVVDAKDVQVRLRSIVGKDKSVVHQLYVADNHDGDWKVWERASGEDGSVLPFAQILNKVAVCNGVVCRLNEHFTALLSDSLLRAHPNGYAVKFYAKMGQTLVVSVPASVIAAQLAAVDSVRALKPH